MNLIMKSFDYFLWILDSRDVPFILSIAHPHEDSLAISGELKLFDDFSSFVDSVDVSYFSLGYKTFSLLFLRAPNIWAILVFCCIYILF